MWSPSGEWILYNDGGVKLVSPDGKATRDVSATSASAYVFSVDGQTLYGIREVAPGHLQHGQEDGQPVAGEGLDAVAPR